VDWTSFSSEKRPIATFWVAVAVATEEKKEDPILVSLLNGLFTIKALDTDIC
jgi:hypothetical protein